MLTFLYQGDTSLVLDLDALTVGNGQERTADEWARIRLGAGNRQVEVGEVFRISGSGEDGIWEFEGDLSRGHGLATGLKQGEIRVKGNVGRRLGCGMKGGTIRVQGDAGDLAGAEMQGGLIHIRGNAGHQAGAAWPGNTRGMTGGVLLIEGNAGRETGRAMRRGSVAVGGSCGDFAAAQLIAGTVMVFGTCGSFPGLGMKRGTLALFTPMVEVPPHFSFSCRYRPQFLAFYLRQLLAMNFPVPSTTFGCETLRYCGDLLQLSKGEILVLAAPNLP